MRLALLLLTLMHAQAASVPEEPVVASTPTGTPAPLSSAGDARFRDISETRLIEILSDPSDRVSSHFTVPEELRPQVGFWFKIYAKYSLYQNVLHDKENPWVVYDVVDVTDQLSLGKSAAAIEITHKGRTNKRLLEIRAGIALLARNPKKIPTTPSAKRVFEAWGGEFRSSAEWKRALANLRVQAGQRDRIMQGIRIADPFIPAMESIFRKFKLPEDLVRIPLIESSFIYKAKSKANAVGVWQFLENSALEYIVVNRQLGIDERLSPIKSTYAAARMFQRNYRILEDWGLAVIAYNHGPKNLVQIRHKYRGDRLVDLLKNKRGPLGFASRNYYCEFLALLHAERYRDEIYGIPLDTTERMTAVSIVRLKKPASIIDVSAMYNISLFELKRHNPDVFDLWKKLPAGTRFVVPRKIGESLVEAPVFNRDAPRSPASREPTAFEFVEYLH